MSAPSVNVNEECATLRMESLPMALQRLSREDLDSGVVERPAARCDFENFGV